MKKSLLALAVLGAFAGAASAQSSVTIYGLLDLAVTKGNGGTATNPGANGTQRGVPHAAVGFFAPRLPRQRRPRWWPVGPVPIEHRFTPDDGGPRLRSGPAASWLGVTISRLVGVPRP